MHVTAGQVLVSPSVVMFLYQVTVDVQYVATPLHPRLKIRLSTPIAQRRSEAMEAIKQINEYRGVSDVRRTCVAETTTKIENQSILGRTCAVSQVYNKII